MIDQVVIGICGMASVWLSQSGTDDVRRWACLFGIVAQPFWFYSSWNAGQWGIVALTFVYAAGWIRGINTYWIKA